LPRLGDEKSVGPAVDLSISHIGVVELKVYDIKNEDVNF